MQIENGTGRNRCISAEHRTNHTSERLKDLLWVMWRFFIGQTITKNLFDTLNCKKWSGTSKTSNPVHHGTNLQSMKALQCNAPFMDGLDQKACNTNCKFCLWAPFDCVLFSCPGQLNKWHCLSVTWSVCRSLGSIKEWPLTLVDTSKH